ncbi:MAG: DNA methyltransferase [Methanothrix soehngenii]
MDIRGETDLAAPKEIVELVERFESNREAYKSGHYNETQVRREFVDPLFKALGWDIDNEQGFAEAYKDVIHEDAIKVGGTTRAPDYSFRIGGQRKFFLETKKPSVDIKEDIHPAFQLRRYAWTAKLPLSILTDFEEFSVYDCTIKPDKKDKPSKGRILYLTCKDYLEQWDEIAAIFSKNAILKGSFDKYAPDKRGKRGTAQVDSAFLEEIAGWREILARNIALRNPELDTRDLNYAVQATVNRIVFLRICEDRGIERLMKMEDLLYGERVYPRLCELFRRADERYNSGIFHFEKEPGRENPDTLSLRLNIDDKPLKDIIRRLYYPDSPYEFSVLPAEILGQVYEQFLGKVIRLTDGHRAVVEDKPEVKKAGGVKYTPAYIVDYIVKNTLGPTLEGKTPSDATKISVLDPACGSGSFLIVAYQHLLDWHREWYVQNLVPMLQSGLRPSSIQIRRMLPGIEGASKGRKKEREPELPVFQGRGGEWRLTTAERKRILLNNIYGVDIDRQAVEVTKLSLLLKVLEGENEETISKQLTLFSERALPDLSRNIKCGNSLIGWDILEDNPSLGQEEIERINPFDWESGVSGGLPAEAALMW